MRRGTGFILIELLIVVAVIAMMAGVYFAWYNPKHSAGLKKSIEGGPEDVPGGTAETVLGKAMQKAESVDCMNDLSQVRQSIVMYSSDAGSYPPNLEALNLPAMIHCPVSGAAYQYDPQTGTVRCPTHPKY